ncbi:hypothetical protein O6H91_08G035800 [Diphasiastrum complanatum]|uniref:Uncharacterized protein n=2 Tax=Diphasiastrum complanatum TaxID=34168 RepID=A0ACC2CWC6_DIPCM|nr:hypothetical protein O6H91_08G035800 [Diphasiastrum complanatum]KAJ7546334.1 hypothetical protein O6H91_08G035800 [Diphasiastrum complanatum]
MGLVSGIFLGVVVGVALVALLNQSFKLRSKQRIAKAADIKLLGDLVQDDLKKLCGANYPSWISFPEFERAASGVIKEVVEPMLEQYRPPGIAALKFEKLFLGNVAPQCEGIRVQSQKKGQITMDLDFRWGGDASIILGIQTLVGASLPIQLKNVQFFATVRTIFQLAEDIPCISAVVVALLAKPKPEVKYLLKLIGGSLTAVPGLSDMIKDMVENILVDTLQWPHRIVVPIGGLPIDLSELELKLEGRLTVSVIGAKSLKNLEVFGKSDPYVVLYARILFKYKTKVVDNNLNPEWNETFELDIEDQETQTLVLQVMDQDITEDKFLGVVSFPLAKLTPEETKEFTLNLLPSLDTAHVVDKKDRGTITVKLNYHIFTKEEQAAAMAAEKEFLEQKKRAKEAGLIGSTLDAVGAVGGAGKALVGTGIGAVGTGLGMVGSGLGKAGKLVGRSVQLGGASMRGQSPGRENGMSR